MKNQTIVLLIAAVAIGMWVTSKRPTATVTVGAGAEVVDIVTKARAPAPSKSVNVTNSQERAEKALRAADPGTLIELPPSSFTAAP